MTDAGLILCLPRRVLAVVGRVTARRRSTALANKLLTLARNPDEPFKEQTFEWAMSYGSPTFLQRLLKSLSGVDTQHWGLNIVRKVDPRLLLPGECTTPDYQMLTTSDTRPTDALICFCDNAFRLNIPVQLFHCAAAGRFDLLIYLRDKKKTGYTSGLTGLGKNLDEVISSLRDLVPSGCRIAVVSASSGGFAAARYASALRVNRLALFSPSSISRLSETIPSGALDSVEDTRIFFAGNNTKDRKRAAEWQKATSVSKIEMLDRSSHGTLRQLSMEGGLDRLIDWLAAGNGRIFDYELSPERSVS